MRTFVCLGAGLGAAFVALLVVISHLDSLSGAMCSPEFALPALACRFGSLGLALSAVPLAGGAVFFAARRASRR